MRRGMFLFIGLALAFIVFWGCAPRQEGVVAKIGKFDITAEELNKNMRGNFQTFDEELSTRIQRVEKLAEDKLILCAAYEEGLDKNEQLVAQLGLNSQMRIISALQQVVVYDKVGEPTEQDIQKVYDRLKSKIHAKHILLETKELADSLYKEIKGGADFDVLAMEFSIDPSTKDKGGDLRFFSAMEMLEPFEDMAYSLNAGDISEPVETRFGWHIINLIETAPNEKVRSLEEEKERILAHIKRARASKLAMDFLDGIKEKANFQFNNDGLNIVFTRYQEMLADTGNPKSVMAFTPEERRMTLLTYSSGKITVEDFDTIFAKVPPFRRPQFNDANAVKGFLENTPMTDLLEKAGIDMGVETSEHYTKLYNDELEREMLKTYRKDYLTQDVEITDDDAKAYYDASPDSFIDPEKVSVIEIQVATEKEAQGFIEQIKGGADIKKLAEEHTLRNYVKTKGGELAFFSENRYPDLFKAAKTLKPGELFPTPIMMNNKYSVIQLIDTQSEGRKPFEQVARQIKNKLRGEKRKNAYEEWLEQAKSKYGYTIYEDEIGKTIDASKYETPAEETESS